MQIEFRLDPECREPRLIILADKLDDEINALIKKLSTEQPKHIAGFNDSTVTMLHHDDIYRVFSADGKVYAETQSQKYTLRLRLYEMEQRLESAPFVRISNSELINLNKVRCFNLSFVGTIRVTLSNGTVTYVSRRFVSKIKHKLGM